MPCKTTPNLIFWTVAQTGKVTPLVSGPPGCGKSRTIEAFARAMSRQCYTLIGSLREPADVGGYPYPVHGEQPYMAVMPPKWAQDCQHGQWVLFLDELTTCPPAVQAALLGVIAENRVGDARAARYGVEAGRLQSARLRGQRFRVGAAAGQSALPPDVGDGHRGVAAGHGQCLGLPAAELRAAAAGLGEVRRPQHRPGRRVPQAQAGAAGSLPQGSGQGIRGVALDPLLDQCGNLRRGAGGDRRRAALALSGRRRLRGRRGGAGVPDVGAIPRPARPGGLVVASRDGPSRRRLALALDIPPRCDQVMAALAALVDRVKNHNLGPNGKPTEGRWLAAVDCFAEVAKCWLEPAIAAAGPLYFAVPHASVLVKAPADFSNTVLQVHKNIMAASN